MRPDFLSSLLATLFFFRGSLATAPICPSFLLLERRYGLDVPLIGIAPWGAVIGRRALHGAKGEMYNYRGGTPGPREARLNPYHTHQILVDAQKDYPEGAAAWGHEIDTRSRLEMCYATAKGVPVVLLVVQGGPNTLDMMSAAAKQGSPLLVLSDSGGAATALAQYCAGGIGRVTDPAFASSEAKLEALETMDKQREGSLITFFRLADDDAEETMSTALLRCLFRNLMFYQHGIVSESASRSDSRAASNRSGTRGGTTTSLLDESPFSMAKLGTGGISKLIDAAQDAAKTRRDHMQRALLLAVKWNQVDFARRMLSELPGHEDYSRPLNKMLQQAIEMQRVEIVQLLLERPGCEVSSLSLCQLFLHEDPYNFLRSDLNLQSRLQRRLADGTLSTRGQSYDTYKEVVGPFLAERAPLLYLSLIHI